MRLLLIAHFYPPSSETGANRPAALARHLRELGHEVTVLTSSAYGEGPSESGVERTWDLQRLQPSGRRRGGGFSGHTYSNAPHPLARVLVPDPYLLAWAPFAAARALRMRRRFDCAISSSPPESSHLVALALAATGVPWVADLRDGWAFEPHIQERLWPTRAQLRLNERLERRLLSRADAVTVVTRQVAGDLRARLGLEAEVIPNGWEQAATGDVPAGPAAGGVALDPERVSLVFTGRLAAGRKDPAPFVQALRELARESPEAAGGLEAVFAGSFTDDERRLFATDVSPARIVEAGNLDRAAVTALQRAADAGLLIAAPTRSQESGSKLFEYIGAGLPILALARPDSAAAEIVADADGVVVDTHDVPAIRAALAAIARGEVGSPPEQLRARYSWAEIAKRMAAVARRACASATSEA